MPQFPTRQDAIEALARQMILGISGNPTVFPRCQATAIQSAITVFNTDVADQAAAKAAHEAATEKKDASLATLVDVMTLQLRQAEVDTANDPVKLALIGWGKKSPKTLPEPPGEPRALEAILQGPGTVRLDWKHPATGVGGTRDFYRIERNQQPAGGGAPSPWTELTTCYETEIDLENQPRGVQLQYRVAAVNHAGATYSAAVDVVL